MRTHPNRLTLVLLLSWAPAGLCQGAIHWTVDIQPTSATTVAPGGTVSFEIVGAISGDANMGLAGWGTDLHCSYAIPNGLPALLPGPQMDSLVKPLGLTNPAGYGGTPSGDDWLLQIGGFQNTIGNDANGGPPYPTGDVVLGIGQQPVQLAHGIANLPTVAGTYVFTLSEPFAMAITSLQGTSSFGRPIYGTTAMASGFGQAAFSVTVLPEPATALTMGVLLLATLRRGRQRA